MKGERKRWLIQRKVNLDVRKILNALIQLPHGKFKIDGNKIKASPDRLNNESPEVSKLGDVEVKTHRTCVIVLLCRQTDVGDSPSKYERL